MPKVMGREFKPNSGSSQYWLILENGQQVPCTKMEYEAGQLARQTGGLQLVSSWRCCEGTK